MLQDHFRPPLSTRRHWHAFHNAWATYIASDLNAKLPEGYFAEPNVQFGIEIDVAAFEESQQEFAQETGVMQLSTEAQNRWIPPEATQTVPFLPTPIVSSLYPSWGLTQVFHLGKTTSLIPAASYKSTLGENLCNSKGFREQLGLLHPGKLSPTLQVSKVSNWDFPQASPLFYDAVPELSLTSF